MSNLGAKSQLAGNTAALVLPAVAMAGGRGRTVVVGAVCDVDITSVSDNAGNTFTQVATYTISGSKVLRLYKCENPIGGSAYQVTVTPSSSNWVGAAFIEILATDPAGAADTNNTGNSDTAPAYVSNSISPVAAAAHVLSVANPNVGGSGTITFTHGSDGFTSVSGFYDSSTGPAVDISYQEGSNPNSYTLNYSAVTTSPNPVAMLLMTLKLLALDRPEVVLIGTVANSVSDASPAWPVGHQADDIGLLVVESVGGESIALGTANGFQAISGAEASTGAGTAGTRVKVFIARATSSSMAAPTVTDPGDHVHSAIHVLRGFNSSASLSDLIDAVATSVKASASTSASAPGVTTTVADTLVMNIISRDTDSSAAAFSAWSNADLTDAWEHIDVGTTGGNGGGVAIYAGHKAAAGSVASTTATVSSSINASITLALRANAAGGGGAVARPNLLLLGCG